MREEIATTPFGRRPLALAQIAARMTTAAAIERAGQPGANQPAAAHKWKLFRALTEAKAEIGVSDRALSVLNALLSFHPETALSLPTTRDGDDEAHGDESAATALIVFPSNRELSLRAHGVGERSLARHLASLVDAGLIARRDSPNGKRYARKARDGGGGFSEAYGFDLTPLVTRAAEFEATAERLRAERRAAHILREKISLHRRDIAKMIACGLEEDAAGDWEEFSRALLGFSAPLRRVTAVAPLSELEAGLARLSADVMRALETHVESRKESGNDRRSDGHQSNSNTQNQNLEPAFKKDRGVASDDPDEAPASPERTTQPGTPLGMVLDACPDIADWSTGGIRTWPDFLAAARLLRPALGISPSAWREAIEAMGEIDASIAVASILQRHESSSDAVTTSSGSGARLTVHGSPAIASAGGYLRALTEQARGGAFAVGPILMALIGQRLKARRGA